MAVPFSHQNNNFIRKCSQTELFQAGRFNFIKIVQHALIYSETDINEKFIRNYFRLPYAIILLIYRTKHLVSSLRVKYVPPALQKLVFIENGRERYDGSGKAVSMYYEKFFRMFPRNEYSILIEWNAEKLKTWDYHIIDLKRKYCAPPVCRTSREVLREIKRVQKKISRSGIFNERDIRYVNVFFHLFFYDLLFYQWLFSRSDVKTCVFDNHHFNEGLIACLKTRGIKSIEIQHGLITQNDCYYVYPELMKNVAQSALFPDRIFVYGQFWKNKLLKGFEYRPEDIVVAGDYTFSASPPTGEVSKENLIFISEQIGLGGYLGQYVDRLLAVIFPRHNDWRVVIKLHPSEPEPQLLDRFRDIPHVQVVGNTADLISLLKRARIHITYYSTTLFDAVGLGVANFSIQDHSPSADYCREMVEDGVAMPIRLGEDPVELYYACGSANVLSWQREYIYDKLNMPLVKNEIAGAAVHDRAD